MDLFECIIKTEGDIFYSIRNKEIKKYNLHYETKLANNLYICSNTIQNYRICVVLNTNNNKLFTINNSCVSEKNKSCHPIKIFSTVTEGSYPYSNFDYKFLNNIYNDKMCCVVFNSFLNNILSYDLISTAEFKKNVSDDNCTCLTCNAIHINPYRVNYKIQYVNGMNLFIYCHLIIYMHSHKKYYVIGGDYVKKLNIYMCLAKDDDKTEQGVFNVHSTQIFSDKYDYRHCCLSRFNTISFYNTFVCYYSIRDNNKTVTMYIVHKLTNNVKKISIHEYIKNIQILGVDNDMIYIYVIDTNELKGYSLITLKTKYNYCIKLNEEIDNICELKPKTFLLMNKKLMSKNKTCITFKLLEISDLTKTTYKITFLSDKIIDDDLMDYELIINISKLSYEKYKYKHITEKICVHSDIWTNIFKNFFIDV